MVSQVIFACISAGAFAALFHISPRHLPLSALGGLLSWAAYLLLGKVVPDLFYRILLVSILTAAYAEIVARVRKAPATLFLLPALIPLVPGSYVYYMMLSLVMSHPQDAREYLLLTTKWAIGLAAGISLVAAAEQILYRREGSGGAGCPGAAVPERTAAPSAAPGKTVEPEKAAAASGPDGREEP
ncbi:threonine/serine exporter family protein [uncultured Oscillibacter sp.]|uniref:threonine/serine exporter family protein n=1 Tax=uncultured Oscillibacter sp. TaxID=876091 RepID=UPI0025FC01FD|nr:threonine/serine exporter family protein [uncultured Oscillibacter sp.]